MLPASPYGSQVVWIAMWSLRGPLHLGRRLAKRLRLLGPGDVLLRAAGDLTAPFLLAGITLRQLHMPEESARARRSGLLRRPRPCRALHRRRRVCERAVHRHRLLGVPSLNDAARAQANYVGARRITSTRPAGFMAAATDAPLTQKNSTPLLGSRNPNLSKKVHSSWKLNRDLLETPKLRLLTLKFFHGSKKLLRNLLMTL